MTGYTDGIYDPLRKMWYRIPAPAGITAGTNPQQAATAPGGVVQDGGGAQDGAMPGTGSPGQGFSGNVDQFQPIGGYAGLLGMAAVMPGLGMLGTAYDVSQLNTHLDPQYQLGVGAGASSMLNQATFGMGGTSLADAYSQAYRDNVNAPGSSGVPDASRNLANQSMLQAGVMNVGGTYGQPQATQESGASTAGGYTQTDRAALNDVIGRVTGETPTMETGGGNGGIDPNAGAQGGYTQSERAGLDAVIAGASQGDTGGFDPSTGYSNDSPSGGGGGGCYITTAATKHGGLSDDGAELNTLRQFRDGVMAQTPQGQAEVQRYYEVAPKVVAAIDARPDADAVYKRLSEEFIKPAAGMVQQGDFEGAFDLYRKMTEFAASIAAPSNSKQA
jgi:hypothetical protein